ncbi:MAG: dihydrolipoyl dehydrogenase [Gammaproteobacteria bacterium]
MDVAVIGAGHAGLNAIKEIRKVTENFVLINGGQLGTTCARCGCMPSKVALHLAESYNNRSQHQRLGIKGGENLRIDIPEAMERIRDLRDMFVDLILANTTDDMGDALIEGYAQFIDARTLQVNDQIIRTNTTVIATGARSCVPPEWRGFDDGILTIETLFEQETLPESIAVLGLGPMGIEIAQALHRLGVRVVGIDQNDRIARIADPVVNKVAIDIIARDFPLWLGAGVSIERQGERFQVKAGDQETEVEKLFIAAGRHLNLDGLCLERLIIEKDHQGVPLHNPFTMQLHQLPIYIAGDAAGGLATLQKAADQGRIAGYNAARHYAIAFKPKTHMSIVFCDPNVASVGTLWSKLDEDVSLVGEIRFGPVGRAVITGRNRGILRIYADKNSGRILGAAMVGAHCEHLAHLLAWAVEKEMTVTEALRMPYYHPVFEEAIQDALNELDRQINGRDAFMGQLERAMQPLVTIDEPTRVTIARESSCDPHMVAPGTLPGNTRMLNSEEQTQGR